MLVMKFGGTSVSDVPRLRELVGIVQSNSMKPLVVVCSALAGVTNSLIDIARSAVNRDEQTLDHVRRQIWSQHRHLADELLKDQWERDTLYKEWAELLKTYDRFAGSIVTLGESTPRAVDALASLGERFSVRLVAALLRENGVAARHIDATELIVTDDTFGAAHPLWEETREQTRQKLEPLLRSGIIPVVTGYIAATTNNIVTTLGRGGSDYSAAILGAALDANEVWIWTDVDGILTADPKIVPEARTLEELSYIEAAELATFGAEVLHPKTLKPLVEHSIPLRIVNTFNPSHPGTRILANPVNNSAAARAIITAPGLSLLTFTTGDQLADDWSPEFAVRAFRALAEVGVEPLMFAQSFGENSLLLVVREADRDFALERLKAAFAPEQREGRLSEVRAISPVTTISVVGAHNSDGTGLIHRTFEALGSVRARVLATAQSASFHHVSFVLHHEDVVDAVRALHTKLGLNG
jgi:aspartate kinase